MLQAVLGRLNKAQAFRRQEIVSGWPFRAWWTMIDNSAARSILALENDGVILMVIESTLSEAGYRVATASTVKDALGHLDTTAFDAAIIDVGMGQGNSFVVADALELRKIPFVFCTASGLPIEGRHRAVPLLEKPFSEQRVIDAVGQILQPR